MPWKRATSCANGPYRTFLSYWLSPIRQCSGERRAIHKSRISAIMKRFMISSNLIRNLKRSSDAIRRHVFWFALFLFSLPFSIRKVFAVFTADGTFNEYLDVSLYLSDVLLCITLILYILENKSYILSISYWRKMFHVEHLLLPIFIPAFFIFWSGLSIFWSESLSLAWFTFLRLIEGFLLYLYILMQNVPRGTLSPQSTKCSTWNILQIASLTIIVSAFFQSLVAILQFIRQKSLGMSFLQESVFSVYDPGVAKIAIDGHIFVRAYGFFPHPNVLGGFLAISLLITMIHPLIFKSKMFHVEHSYPNQPNQPNVPRGTFSSFISAIVHKCSTWNIVSKNNQMFHVEHPVYIWGYRVVIFAQLLALSFSFSKSAILAFIIGLIIAFFSIQKMFHVEHLQPNQPNVPRGTFKKSLSEYIAKCSTWNIDQVSVGRIFKKMFHVEHWIVILAVVLSGMAALSFDLKLFFTQPLLERLFYMQAIEGLYKAYFFQGLGIGQFVFDMQQFFDEKLLVWQLQPIHNVFLLIWSEAGIVGLGLFLWFLIYAFLENEKNVPRGTLAVETEKCSTWNIGDTSPTKMFHVEHSVDIGPGGISESRQKVISAYLFRSILIVIILIILFDHYFWDIQQGQLLLWMMLALAASRKGT